MVIGKIVKGGAKGIIGTAKIAGKTAKWAVPISSSLETLVEKTEKNKK